MTTTPDQLVTAGATANQARAGHPDGVPVPVAVPGPVAARGSSDEGASGRDTLVLSTRLPRLGMSPDPQRPETRRQVGSPREERLDLWGGVIAAAAVAALLSSGLGLVSAGWTPLTAYLAFLVLHLALVRLAHSRQGVHDRLVTVLLWTAGMAVLGLLVLILGFVVTKGWRQLTYGSFFREDMGGVGPLSPLTRGGILHALVGTLEQIGIALVVCVPLALLSAVFLNEVGGRFARFVRVVVEAMTALPSVVAGLFVYASLVHLMGGFSGFAAAIAISVLMLPIMIRSADSVLRLVPGNLREAGYALGGGQLAVVRLVVLPTVRSGLATALILGTAHGIGETAPVMLTAGLTKNLNLNPFSGPQTPLTLTALEFIKSPQQADVIRGYATATVLLALVVVLFALARFLGGKEPGNVSGRRLSVLAGRSRRTLARIEAGSATARTAGPDGRPDARPASGAAPAGQGPASPTTAPASSRPEGRP